MNKPAFTLARGDRVRITVGSRSLTCRITQVTWWPGEGWDLEYRIENPLPGHGDYGRYKQWADGGSVTKL